METYYDYANARLRAMKSRLLQPTVYADLLNAPSPEDLVAYLIHTPYRKAMEKALVTSSGWECLAAGLREYLGETLDKIGSFFRGDAGRLWGAIIGRWQVFNLKTVLRGQAHAVPAGEILGALVPVGDLHSSDFQRLVQQTSVRATVDLLATWRHPLAPALLTAMAAYAEHRDLAGVEMALDRARFRVAFEQVAGVRDSGRALVERLLCREVDATNVTTVIRLSASGLSGARFAQRYGTDSLATVLIPGGHSLTERLSAYREIPSLEQVERDMQATGWGHAPAQDKADHQAHRVPAMLERAIEDQVDRERYGLFSHDPLSIGIAVAYLTALVNEARNLRIIGRGKAAGLGRAEMEKELRLWPN